LGSLKIHRPSPRSLVLENLLFVIMCNEHISVSPWICKD
jgi:hypothetical protein